MRTTRTIRQAGRRAALVFVAAVLCTAPPVGAEPLQPGGSDGEIRIGSLMPYTGQLAAFGTIGRAEAAYFDMINDQGGINGRKGQIPFL